MKNLFSSVGVLSEELVEKLVEGEGVIIERIVSQGHKTVDGEWFDQDKDEWVVLLSGAARLHFDGQQDPVTLLSGDHILIPAHTRHRVEWTDPAEDSVWLAVHFNDGG